MTAAKTADGGDRTPERPAAERCGRGARFDGEAAPRGGEERSARTRGRKRSEPDGPARPRRRLLRRILLWSGAAFLVLLLAGFIAVLVVLDKYSDGLPSVEDLREKYGPPQVSRVYARDERTVIGEFFAEEGRRTVVPLEDIPRIMIEAVIAAEDARFRSHAGLDWFGMVRSLVVNVWKGYYAQGGSTLTQQVVRTFYLGREKTLERKVKEVLLARMVEQHLSKDQILFLYLNQICFGHGRYGVEEAARFYFGKGVREVTLAEAALLAALPKGPAIYSPRVSPEKAVARRHYVLRQMERNGFITTEQMRSADAEPIRLAPVPEGMPGWSAEFAEAVRAELSERIGEIELARGGYRIVTTLDPALQRAARRIVVERLREVDARHGYRGPLRRLPGDAVPPPGGTVLPDDAMPEPNRIYVGRVVSTDDAAGTIRFRVGAAEGEVRLSAFPRYAPEGSRPSVFAEVGARARVRFLRPPEPDGRGELRLELGPEAAVVLIAPATGEVVAMVGSSTGGVGEFNRVMQARRQPGSAFKPLVYLSALEARRVTPATVLDDAPVAYGAWRPRNAGDRFLGPIPAREALARSVNVVAVKLLEETGIDRTLALARSLGIASPLRRELTLALGASETTPLELASAMAVVAAGGVRRTPTLIREIRHADGGLVDLGRPAPTRIVSAAAAFVLTDMLRSVIEDPDGTAHEAAGRLGRSAAGKTGTSTDARDAWFVGFTPDWVAGVWVGFDDNLPLAGEEPPGLSRADRAARRRHAESGGRTALPIWVDLMRAAHADRPETPFSRPAGVTTAIIDPATGLLAGPETPGARREWFIEGTAPVERAPVPVTAPVETFALDEADRLLPP